MRLAHRPPPDLRLKHHAFKKRPNERHPRRRTFNVFVVRIDRMMMQMRHPIRMPASNRRELDDRQKEIIDDPRKPKIRVHQVMRYRPIRHKTQTDQTRDGEWPVAIT